MFIRAKHISNRTQKLRDPGVDGLQEYFSIIDYAVLVAHFDIKSISKIEYSLKPENCRLIEKLLTELSEMLKGMIRQGHVINKIEILKVNTNFLKMKIEQLLNILEIRNLCNTEVKTELTDKEGN